MMSSTNKMLANLSSNDLKERVDVIGPVSGDTDNLVEDLSVPLRRPDDMATALRQCLSDQNKNDLIPNS